MSTVHTEYGPGRIIAQETVRGRTRFKVAGEGFEVWLDQTRLGGYEPPADGIDYNAPHWHDHGPGSEMQMYPAPPEPLSDDEYAEYADPRGGHFDRARLRTHPDYLFDDDGDARFARRVVPGKAGRPSHLAWAPIDDDNSTALPYNPDPQHDAIGTPGDDGSATIQPIHHIDADERLRSSDSISFDDVDDGEEPGPNPDLFAKQASPSPNMVKGLGQMAVDAVGLGDKINLHDMHKKLQDRVRDQVIQRTNNPELADKVVKGVDGGLEGASAAGTIAAGEYAVGRSLDNLDPGYDSGWGEAIHKASLEREAFGQALLPLVGPALRTLGPMAVNHLMNGGGYEGGPGGPGVLDGALSGTDPGSGWDDAMHEASYRPAGLSDRYIDITAGADYHNDPVAQFRHDPDAYINRVGHLMDEGLNPRFAEYMDLVEGDSSVRTAAWKDVRAKAMRLKTSGAVHVKDIAPTRIMASVDGDHGTYDVVILKGASYGGLSGGQSISNWHCGCEWGRWAFRRKFTYVGRLCSHAYASYLTMQSAHMTGNPRQQKGPKRKAPSRALPFLHVKRADNLQNGPQRLVPELAVNDTDDAHTFLDVTTDERDDVGPDDVVSDKDIVHFARLMRHCEITEQPYPRQLVAFLSRYADCNDGSDDVVTDFQASDADDADEYLDVLRTDADRKQEDDFGNMAERVRKIQDAVEEARAHGADADRFVAMVRKVADPISDWLDREFDPATGRDKVKSTGKPAPTTMDALRDRAGVDKVYDPSLRRDVSKNPPKTEATPSNAADNIKADNEDDFKDSGSKLPADKNMNNPPMPKTPKSPSQPPSSPQSAPPTPTPEQAAPAEGAAGVGDGSNAGATGAGTGAGTYTAPGGGQTSGTIADGGVAGAENGNNSAITKNMLDADGTYTVQKGDTWSDIAQRTTGDMNNYQKMYDVNKGVAGGNIDSLAEGTKINLKDFANDTGNAGVSGDKTNPAGGGLDKNPATADSGPAVETGYTSPSGNTLSTAQGFAGGAPKVNTEQASNPATPVATPPTGGQVAQDAVQPPATPKTPEPAAPAAPANEGKPSAARRTAKDWLRWAAEQDGSPATNETAETTAQPASATTSTNPNSGAGAAQGTRSAPATNPAQTTPGTPSSSDVYDPTKPEQVQQQSMNSANPGAQAGGSNSATPGLGGMEMGDIGSMIGQGVGAATDIASGIGQAIPGIVQGIGSIFASRQDFDDWARYAYPTGAGDDDDPETLPHLPFAGSGNPGSLEFSTSEEYADKARAKMDDVTDLGDDPLSTPMGEWQKQGGYETTDDNSDIVRRFQAHMGGFDAPAGGGGGRFDDIAGAAAGFLRTAGRNYSLAEQSELIREGDKGGARNLDSLDLRGTHYEDMETLGW